jgi:hypothetical protein
MANGKKGARASKTTQSNSNLLLAAAAVVALIATTFFISNEDIASVNDAVVQAFEHDTPSKFYFMYEVGPGERFNMRRDRINRQVHANTKRSISTQTDLYLLAI